VTDKADMPILTMDKPIPNEEHPSDHLPLVFTIAFTKKAAQMEMFARSWALVVLSGASSRPNDAGDDLSLAQVSATTGYSPLLDPSSTLHRPFIAPNCPSLHRMAATRASRARESL
jgi:hypothetical protein